MFHRKGVWCIESPVPYIYSHLKSLGVGGVMTPPTHMTIEQRAPRNVSLHVFDDLKCYQ